MFDGILKIKIYNKISEGIDPYLLFESNNFETLLFFSYFNIFLMTDIMLAAFDYESTFLWLKSFQWDDCLGNLFISSYKLGSINPQTFCALAKDWAQTTVPQSKKTCFSIEGLTKCLNSLSQLNTNKLKLFLLNPGYSLNSWSTQ